MCNMWKLNLFGWILKIMFKTVKVMLTKEGINAPDQEVGAVRFQVKMILQSESIRK